MPAWTTEEFVSKARDVHGEKYDYDRAKYLGSRELITITCRTHGDFNVRANSHVQGGGCAQCDKDRRAISSRKTSKQFIIDAQNIHGTKYDYSKTQYVHSLKDITITCKTHGDFLQKANIHLSGSGCQKCAVLVPRNATENRRTSKYTTAEFVEKAKSLHGDTYDYSKVIYKNSRTSVTLICNLHGDFQIEPSNHIHEQAGCYKCGDIASSAKRCHSLAEFIRKARATHGNRYDYSQAEYVNIDSKVNIICDVHGGFEQIAYNHISGQQCPACANRNYTTDIFVTKADIIHKGKYQYDLAIYTGSWQPISVSCKVHGPFKTQPYRHLQGSGCPRCSQMANSSKMQVQWLEWQAVKRGSFIQHVDNIGEYRVSNSRYLADGFEEASNTVFEFNGDYFHGNPAIYDPTEWNSKLKCTFGDALKKTKSKKDHVLKEGYQICDIWEADWKELIKRVKVIQRAWRRRERVCRMIMKCHVTIS